MVSECPCWADGNDQAVGGIGGVGARHGGGACARSENVVSGLPRQHDSPTSTKGLRGRRFAYLLCRGSRMFFTLGSVARNF
jgi:hypothetical protein